MPRTLSAKRCSLAFLVLCALAFAYSPISAAQKPDKAEFLKKARQSYYSLKQEGMAQIQCSMDPDWKFLLQSQNASDPSKTEAAIKTLNTLHFGVVLGLDGMAKVTHNELTPENAQVAQGLKDIYNGTEQMASGFFQTWSGYMIAPLLPEPGQDFALEAVGAGFRVSYKDGTADVVTQIGQDYAITEQNIKTSDFDAVIKPQFRKSPKGYILTAYQATYRGANGTDATALDVTIAYQDVNAMQFPQEIVLSGSYGPTPFKAKVAFSGCLGTRQ